MSSRAAMSAAILAAFNLDTDGAKPEVVADAAAAVLCSFAAAVRGELPARTGLPTTAAPCDVTLELILAEMRKQTALLTAVTGQAHGARRAPADESGLPG